MPQPCLTALDWRPEWGPADTTAALIREHYGLDILDLSGPGLH